MRRDTRNRSVGLIRPFSQSGPFLSLHVDPREDPMELLGACPPERSLDIPLFESQLNHSFVGEPHGGRQLWEPEMRLLGFNSLGLTIYL